MTARIIGEKELTRKLTAMSVEFPFLAEAALVAEAELIRTASMIDTPVKRGTLKGSHRVTSKITAEGPEAKISVGGAAKKYAIPVHEKLNVKHTVGKAKFLEDAANAAMEGMRERLGARIAAGMRAKL